VSQFLKFRCPLGPKSTQIFAIHFTPLRGVSDKIRSAEGTDPIFYVSGTGGTGLVLVWYRSGTGLVLVVLVVLLILIGHW